MDVDCDDAPFELTEHDHLALANAYAYAHAQSQAFNAYAADDSGGDLLGIDDPDLLDIPHLCRMKRGVS